MKRLLLVPVLALGLTACSAVQIQQATTTIEGDIQAAAASFCGIVPTLQTITSVAGVLYPGIGSITALAVAGEQAVAADICGAAPPLGSARYRALPPLGYKAAVIGVTPSQVVVKGWRVQ